MDGQLILYSSEYCTYCKEAKALLKKFGIEYINKDISDVSNLEELYMMGAMHLPVLVVGLACYEGSEVLNAIYELSKKR